MTKRQVRVLLGDSTPTELPPNILDVVTEVILCVRDVATPFAEIQSLEQRRVESVEAAEAMVKELDDFARQTQIGVRATAGAAARTEMRAHGEEVVDAIGRLIEGWKRQYERKAAAATQSCTQRTAQLVQGMHKALERFLLPRRKDAPVQRFHRFFDGQRYLDTAMVEPFEGVRITLSLRDPEPEVPRRVRSLIGKGNKLQVGTRLSRLRRVEEPIVAVIDDLLVLDVERGPGRLRVLMAKKPGTADVVRVELMRSEDGRLVGRVARGDGPATDSPPSDRTVLATIWRSLDRERERILECSAQMVEVTLHGHRVDDADKALLVADRLVESYRSTVATLSRHSPNPEELTIKVESEDGRREEVWVRRDELAQHLLGLPGELRGMLGMTELFDGADVSEAKTSVHAVVAMEIEEDQSVPIEFDAEPRGDGVPGAPAGEMTQDISLGDVVVESGPLEDGCAEPVRVRSR